MTEDATNHAIAADGNGEAEHGGHAHDESHGIFMELFIVTMIVFFGA